MAKPVRQITLGIDVAKDQLVARDWAAPEGLMVLENDPRAIRAWLRGFAAPVRLALEPTSTYHLACVDEALKLGLEVYLIGTRQLAHYREAVAVRNKTDPDDAYLLARYLAHEAEQLRRYGGLSPRRVRPGRCLHRHSRPGCAGARVRHVQANANSPNAGRRSCGG